MNYSERECIEQREEIKRLRERADTAQSLAEDNDRLCNEQVELKQRIEELEQINLDLKVNQGSTQTISQPPCQFHHIPDKEVDAAVEWAQGEDNKWQQAGDEEAYARAVGAWATLAGLGFERCDGCGGSGRFEADGLYEVYEDCEDCNGRGWKRKSEKERS